MFDVYRELRKSDSIPSFNLDIRKSGWKIKLEGAPELSDKGIEELVKQQLLVDGRILSPVKGKVETDTHKGQVSFPSLPLPQLLSLVQGKPLPKKDEETPTNGSTKAPKGKGKKAAKNAEELNRGGVDPALTNGHAKV